MNQWPQKYQYPWKIVCIHLTLNNVCRFVFIDFYRLQVPSTFLQAIAKQEKQKVVKVYQITTTLHCVPNNLVASHFILEHELSNMNLK